ncbi:hypothetical protein K470DRAFT_219693 [Piedraia hortae CBS 480.64]|uniref:Uncharacterized protein n=1 Tax=Piedraia hortae CBS 480.64 TaxID=1314780 RepID=A0A6A7BWW5_9PEZI|nr:hypothetical protein K470DRAFT_219693 [Piedraia hortae CBS 480.64]
MERTVRRADLLSPKSPPIPEDTVAEELLRSGQWADWDYVQPETANSTAEHPQDESLEFCLFAPNGSTGGVVKVRLKSPTPPSGDGGFIQPKRPREYYFAETSSARKKEYEASAVSGAQVLARSKQRQPGNAYEWKVLNLPLSSLSREARIATATHFNSLVDDEPAKKRTRPGKKYRLRLRARAQALKNKEQEKEMAIKEKKTRINRSKKLRRREKARTAKQNAAAPAD